MRLKLREEKESSFEVSSRVEEKRTRGRSFQEEPDERMTLRRDVMSRVASASDEGRISRRTRPPILVIMGVNGLKVRQIKQENARIFLCVVSIWSGCGRLFFGKPDGHASAGSSL